MGKGERDKGKGVFGNGVEIWKFFGENVLFNE